MTQLRRLCSLFLLLAISTVAFAQKETVTPQPEKKPGPAKPAHPTASKSAAASPTPNLADFDAYVTRTMDDWKVPGAAIVIVKDGKVILSKGYGLRDVQKKLPVTEQTLFPIASITKSFTVATLGTLASEGK